MPMTVMRTSGSVRHIRPLPSDSRTTTVPGLGDREVGAGDGDPRPQELLAEVEPGGLGELRGLVGQAVRRRPPDAAHLVDEDVADLRSGCGGSPGPGCATAGRGRAGRSSRRGRSPRRRCPSWRSASLSSISWVAIDLTLTTSVAPWSRTIAGDDRVRLGGVAGPVDDAAGRGHGPLELLEQRRQVAQDLVLDRRAREAKRLPVGALGDDGGALRPDRGGRPAEVRPELLVGQGGPGGLGERRRARRRSARARSRAVVRRVGSRVHPGLARSRRGSRRGA